MAKRNKSVFLLLASLALSGCSNGNTPLISAFIYDSTDPFIASLRHSLIGRVPERYRITVDYAERKQTVQNDQIIASLQNDNPSLLIVNTVDRLASSVIIEKAYSKKTPVVFINREPLSNEFHPASSDEAYNEWVPNNCYYVGSDPAYEGVLQAEIANDYFKKNGGFPASFDKNGDGVLQVAILKGEQGHQDSEERSKNSINHLSELSEKEGYAISLIDSAYCNWERDVAKEKMSSFHVSDIELLMSNNDEMALGAIDYLSSLPSDERPSFPIVGVDATTSGRAAVEEGTMIGTVLNDAGRQASLIFEICDSIIQGTPLPTGQVGVTDDGHSFHVKGSVITKQ